MLDDKKKLHTEQKVENKKLKSKIEDIEDAIKVKSENIRKVESENHQHSKFEKDQETSNKNLKNMLDDKTTKLEQIRIDVQNLERQSRKVTKELKQSQKNE